MAAASKRKASGESRWLELAAEFPLRPIEDDDQLARAIAVIDRLTDRPRLSKAEEDYRTVLGDLVHAYEEEHDPIEDVPPAEMVKHLIEAKGVTQAEAAAALGVSKATITQIIKGDRWPGRKLMAAMGDYFAVNPAVFL
jgi:HTH-type transcriptional regulator/antitoxin HigA